MKKGQLEASQVITLIMAIVGFIVVLILLFTLNLNDYSNDEVCHASVLSRASLPESTQGYVPLKCTTNKICITDKTIGGKCEQFLGEKDVMYIRLSGNSAQKTSTMEEVNAEAMYNCWNMLGQGKLDLFATPISLNPLANVAEFLNLNRKKASCVICARVAIDEDFVYKDKNAEKKEFTNEYKEISNNYDFQNYLAHHGPEGSDLTYLQLFTDKQVRAFPSKFTEDENFGTLNNNGVVQGTDQLAIIFAQVKTDEDPSTAAGKGAIGAGAFILGGSYALGTTGTLIKGAIKHPFIALATAIIAVGGTAGLKAYGAYKDQSFAAVYCGKFSKDSNAQDNTKDKFGCSAVIPVNYNNITKVNEYCGTMEGNP